jgi:hypothetical protein
VIVKPDELFALHRPGQVLTHSAITVLTHLVTALRITSNSLTHFVKATTSLAGA